MLPAWPMTKEKKKKEGEEERDERVPRKKETKWTQGHLTLSGTISSDAALSSWGLQTWIRHMHRITSTNQPQHSHCTVTHSTVTAQSQHSHSTVTALPQSQPVDWAHHRITSPWQHPMDMGTPSQHSHSTNPYDSASTMDGHTRSIDTPRRVRGAWHCS